MQRIGFYVTQVDRYNRHIVYDEKIEIKKNGEGGGKIESRRT